MFNAWLNTPLRRTLFVFAVMCLLLALLKVVAGTVWPQRIVIVLIFGMGAALLYQTWTRWHPMRKQVMRWEMRIVRSWRKFSKTSPIVGLLQTLGFAIVFISVALTLSGWHEQGAHVLWGACAVLSVAGVCDITVQTSRIIRKAWAPTVGKILALSIGVALAALSLSVAKQIAHTLSHVDPKYTTEFTAILAALLLPVIYMAAASVLLFVYGFFQLCIVALLASGNMLYEQFQPLVSNKIKNSVALFWYRIRTGKKPMGGVLPAKQFMSQAEISLIASPLSKFAVVLVLTGSLQLVADEFPAIRPLLTKAIVLIEYRRGGSCTNIKPDVPLVYMDDGLASVATLADDQYTFDVQKCEYEKPKPGEHTD